MIRFESVTLFDCAIPIKRSIRNVQPVKRVLLIKFGSTVGDVWTECSSLEVPGYHFETIDKSKQTLIHRIFPRILGRPFSRSDGFVGLLNDINDAPFATAAVDTAAWIAVAVQKNRALACELGGTLDRVNLGATSDVSDVDDRLIQELVEHRMSRLKIKIAFNTPVADVVRCRTMLPNSIRLTADANGGFDATSIDRLKRLVDAGIDTIEQPCQPSQWALSRAVERILSIPLIFDEPIHSVVDLFHVPQRHPHFGISVKPGRLGGLTPTLNILQTALSNSVNITFGGMVETPIGMAARLALASVVSEKWTGDWVPQTWYWSNFPVVSNAPTCRGGLVVNMSKPGLGIIVDERELSRFVTETKFFAYKKIWP